MKKNKTLYIILGVVALLVILVLLGRLTNKPDMILFFGDTCPHCQNLEKYLADNNIRSKVKFQELEVYNNKDNAQLLAQTAQKCGVDTTNGIGVPFFFDGKNCLEGEQPIENFLQGK
jgi:glutaredoxin